MELRGFKPQKYAFEHSFSHIIIEKYEFIDKEFIQKYEALKASPETKSALMYYNTSSTDFAGTP